MHREKDDEIIEPILRIVKSPARTLCDEHLPVKMCDSDDLSSYVIVQSVDSISVDKAVTNPTSSLHSVVNLTNNLDNISHSDRELVDKA